MEAVGGDTAAANGKDEDAGDNEQGGPCNKGKLIVDATCTPADIAYPTDLSLLNEARETSEEIIDATGSYRRDCPPFPERNLFIDHRV